MRSFVRAFVYFSMLNFVVFLALTFRFGGDALNGKAGDGHYYLASHGKLTEVSREVFQYSRWHALTLAISWPGVMLGAWWLNMHEKQD